MKTIRKLDSTGDTAITFDETDAAAALEARRTIEKMMAGGVLFDVSGGNGSAKRVDSIDDVQAEGLIVPIIQAG